MNKENCKSWNLQKEEDEQSMVELVECCPEDHYWEDQNGWRGAKTLKQGRLGMDTWCLGMDTWCLGMDVW